MKKGLLLFIMITLVTSLSFARDRGSEDRERDFYELHQLANNMVMTPEKHAEMGMDQEEVAVVKDIINKGWYEMKLLEADKLKEVFAIDRLLIGGVENKGKLDKHFKKIKGIDEKMAKLHKDTMKKLSSYIDVEKLK